MLAIVRTALAAAITCAFSTPSLAQSVAASAGPAPALAIDGEKLATDINEEIARIPVSLKLPGGIPYTGDMLVTHFRPNGAGPFPVAVISHGRTAASRNEPARWRMLGVARYLVRRGFAVIVPTRVGYGELGQAVDPEASGRCADADFRPAVEAMSAQVAKAVEFARGQAWANADRVMLIGVSYGGFGT